MKKILGVSLVALMAVSTARADIASTAYVNAKTGDLGELTTSAKTNLVAAINSINTTAGGAVVAAQGSENANKAMITNASGGVVPGTITSGMITDETITTSDLAASIVTSLGKADTAVQSVVAGDGNGQIKVDGTNINVTGLGTAAYEAATAFDAAGTAAGLVGDRTGWETTYGTGVDTVSEAIAAVNTKAGNALTSSSALDGANITAGTVPETALDTATQNKIDGAVQEVSSGTSTSGNGTIIVDGSPVSVYGLDSAAYTASTAYLPAVATSSTGTDGTYVLTMKDVAGVQTLAWELITRAN